MKSSSQTIGGRELRSAVRPTKILVKKYFSALRYLQRPTGIPSYSFLTLQKGFFSKACLILAWFFSKYIIWSVTTQRTRLEEQQLYYFILKTCSFLPNNPNTETFFTGVHWEKMLILHQWRTISTGRTTHSLFNYSHGNILYCQYSYLKIQKNIYLEDIVL